MRCIKVLIVMNIQIAVFWHRMPCGLLNGYQCFRGICCLNFLGKVTSITRMKAAGPYNNGNNPAEYRVS